MADRDAVTTEGAALLRFPHPDAAPDVRLIHSGVPARRRIGVEP